jgi:hypothetical protein
MAKVPPRRRNLTKQDVRWKLAEVRARQLADAISAARVPFFLALAWGFSWAFALYEAEFSYTHTYLTRYNYFQTLSSELKKVGPPENEELLREQMRLRVELAEFCNRILPSTQENPILERTYKLDQIVHEMLCDNLIAWRHDKAATAEYDSLFVSFPGGFGKLYVPDLAIMGNIGLLLLLTWMYFAARRENHAIKTFVNIKNGNKRGLFTCNHKYTLDPQDKRLHAEHYVYVYHAIAERFLFILSQWSRPLLGTTAILIALPAVVSALHFYTDAHDVLLRFFEKSVLLLTMCELALVILVIVVTKLIISLVVDTSTLLNAWYLAVQQVWVRSLDEATPTDVTSVSIEGQSAQALVGSDG